MKFIPNQAMYLSVLIVLCASLTYGLERLASSELPQIHELEAGLSEKPTRVNLQIDLENDADKSEVYAFLREIESYNFRATFYVTKEFALKFPSIIRDIRKRGHEIALHGSWDNALSYNEQLFLLKESAAALQNISMQGIIHYRPKAYSLIYETNNMALRAIQAAGFQTITAHMAIGENFPCCYSRSLGRVGRPMHLPEGIIALPISVIGSVSNETSSVILVDSEIKPDAYLDYLIEKYNESSQTKEPMIIVMHISKASLHALEVFLRYIAETKGIVSTTSSIMSIANPYISSLTATATPDKVCKYEDINVEIAYTSTVYCPTYYFRAYGRYPSQKKLSSGWTLLVTHSEYVTTGSHKFNWGIEIPNPPSSDDTEYEIIVVGRACRGGLNCWPTYDSYEMKYELKIKVNKFCLLAVPVRWASSQAVFNGAVDRQVNLFISDVPLKNCPDQVKIKKLDVLTQNFAGFSCSSTNCNVNSIKTFARGLRDIDLISYDVIVGILENSPCAPIAGCSNSVDTIWVTTRYDGMTAHELGHIFGLSDQYCSNPAGSSDGRCNDGGVGGWWNLWGLLGWDANPLIAGLSYDCPPDGKTMDSTGQLCCNNPNLANCSKVNYGVCCYGNKNSNGGRSTMSYANAPDPRGFDIFEKAILSGKPKLQCGKVTSTSNQMAYSLQANGGEKSIVESRIMSIDLTVYKNESVVENNITLISGEPAYYSMPGSNYNLTIFNGSNGVVWNSSFGIYFDYDGPVEFGANYSNISYDSFPLTFRIPHLYDMKKLVIHHNNKSIFLKNLSFLVTGIRGTVRNINGIQVAGALLDLEGKMYGSAYTNAKGEYQFIGLKEGAYQIFATPPPFDNLMKGSASTNVYRGKMSVINFTLGMAGSIAGLVKNESGAPISNVVIYTSGYETPRYTPNESGFYIISELEDGTYTVYLDALNTPYDGASKSMDVELGKTRWLNFTLKRAVFGSLEGAVIAQNGSLVYGAYILIEGPEIQSAYTDINGRYKFARIANGTYNVWAYPPYDSDLTSFFIKTNITPFTTTYLNITLSKGSVIDGYVFDYKKEPVYSAYIYALCSGYPRSTYTNVDGSYILIGLPGGECILSAEPPYGKNLSAFTTSLNITAGKLIHLNITLEKGKTLSGYIFNSDNEAMSNILIGLSSEDNWDYYTDENGYFEFQNLAKGIYNLIINSFLVNYTTIDFMEDFFGKNMMVNLTEDLEINATLLKIDTQLGLSSFYFAKGYKIELNVTTTNKEGFNLLNWSFLTAASTDNGELIYFNMTPTMLPAGEIKSIIFTFKIPKNITGDMIYVVGGIINEQWGVKSSKGAMEALAYKLDAGAIYRREEEKIRFNSSLYKGWNLVSIPLVLEDNMLPAPLESIEGSYSHGFAYTDGKWYSYYAGEPATYKLIEPTIGFWINMTREDILEVEGYLWDGSDFTFNPGWNLIGYPFLDETNLSGVTDTVIYAYNRTWSSYTPNRTSNSLETLKPGYGYWVKVK